MPSTTGGRWWVQRDSQRRYPSLPLASGPRHAGPGHAGRGEQHADDINDATQVVGASQTADGNDHAFLWTAARGMEDLGTLGGPTSTPFGISETGVVVGISSTAAGTERVPVDPGGRHAESGHPRAASEPRSLVQHPPAGRGP